MSSHGQVSPLVDIECKIRQCQFLPESRLSYISVRSHVTDLLLKNNYVDLSLGPYRLVLLGTYFFENLTVMFKMANDQSSQERGRAKQTCFRIVEMQKMRANITPAAKQLDGA